MPQHVKAEHPTGLQKRLIDEVASMMRANDKKLSDLARDTGLGKSYLSLLLHGKRPGTMATWDLLIATGKSWGIVVPQRLLVDGYNPKRPTPPLGDLDDTKRLAEQPEDHFSIVDQGSGGGGSAGWVPGLDCGIGDPEPEQNGAPHSRNDVTGQPNRFRPLP